MPNVVLESVGQAKAQLEKLGLIVQTVVTGSGNSLVVGQIPGAGTLVHEGQIVKLFILQ
jgi:beta-lactam-binding protein with PASTA domain